MLEKFEVIELKWISQSIQAVLGSDFRVSTQTQSRIESDGKIDVVLLADRIPFALDGINSETLNITLEVYAPVSRAIVRDNVLAALNKLIGHRDGTIKTDAGKEYKYASFLEFSRPLGAPSISEGEMRQLFTITGTMLVADAAFGAVIANQVFTKLQFDVNGIVYESFIPTLRIDTALQFASESMPTGNDNTMQINHNARGVNREISAILLNRDIDDVILKLANEVMSGVELNEIVIITRIYPRYTVTRECKLLTVSLSEAAGAYITYTLGLQEITDDSPIEPSETRIDIHWENSYTHEFSLSVTNMNLTAGKQYRVAFDYEIKLATEAVSTGIYWGTPPNLTLIKEVELPYKLSGRQSIVFTPQGDNPNGNSLYVQFFKTSVLSDVRGWIDNIEIEEVQE